MGFSLLRIMLHSTALASMSYGYLDLHNAVLFSLVKNQFGGPWQFLTVDGYKLHALPLK